MKVKCFTTFIKQGLFTDSSQSLSKAEPLYLNLKDWWTIHSTYFCSKKANNQIMKLNRNMSGLHCLTSAVTRLLRLLRSHTQIRTSRSRKYNTRALSTLYSHLIVICGLEFPLLLHLRRCFMAASEEINEIMTFDSPGLLCFLPVNQSFFLDIFTSFQIFCMLTFSLH